MSERDPWLTEKEAAKELRVSVYVVRAEREEGRLAYARVRRRVFYPLSMIEAYTASLICPAKSNSGSLPSPVAGTSHGRSRGARTVAQRALETAAKLKPSARPSSSIPAPSR